ncbi:hypothetical protein B0H14DRAFT_2585408 [Mycena olivaceomarginata]|nr:hypothetical protein B0H14DRAFT_2585408 [Mycena olivaceomarginata]
MRIAEWEERVHFLVEEERKKSATRSGDKDGSKKDQHKDKSAGNSTTDPKSGKPPTEKKSKGEKKKDYRDSKVQKDKKKKEDRDRKKRLREEAPAARAARVDFDEIERLTAVKLANKLGLMAMYPVEPYKIPEWVEACEEVLIAKTIADLHVAIPFLLDNHEDFDPENAPDNPERFFMYSTSETEFAIIGRRQGGVPKDILRQEKFDRVDWVKWQMGENYDARGAKFRAGREFDSDSNAGSEAEGAPSLHDRDMPELQSVSNSTDTESECGDNLDGNETPSFDEISSLNLDEEESVESPGLTSANIT